MKRLLLITLLIITLALAGVLHGGFLHQEREGSLKQGLLPEKMPDIILDSSVLPSPLL